MNRIDRYISSLFLAYLIGALLVFVTIFIAIDAMSTIVTYKDASAMALISYYAYSLPEIIYRMIPVACLISTVFTISTLNKSNELIALYSIGMSLYRLMMPLIFWVSIVSVISFYMSDRLLPVMTKNKNFVFFKDIKKKSCTLFNN